MKTLPEKIMGAYWTERVPKCISFVPNDVFREKGAFREFDRYDPELPEPYGKVKRLTKDQEYELFTKYNYAKYRASRSPKCNRYLVQHWLTKAAYYKDSIAYHNMPMTYYWVQRYVQQPNEFDDLRSEANVGLNYAIIKFDAARGYKFSTYATLAIKHRIWAWQNRKARHGIELSNEYDVDDPGSYRDIDMADAAIDIRVLLDRSGLTDIERLAVAARYGLGASRSSTYIQLGTVLGVSKTMVQNILEQALRKISISYDNRQKARDAEAKTRISAAQAAETGQETTC